MKSTDSTKSRVSTTASKSSVPKIFGLLKKSKAQEPIPPHISAAMRVSKDILRHRDPEKLDRLGDWLGSKEQRYRDYAEEQIGNAKPYGPQAVANETRNMEKMLAIKNAEQGNVTPAEHQQYIKKLNEALKDLNHDPTEDPVFPKTFDAADYILVTESDVAEKTDEEEPPTTTPHP